MIRLRKEILSIVEEIKINLEWSYKLNRTALKQICDVLEEQSKKIKNENKESKITLAFEIESKKKYLTTHTSESFLNLIPKSFTDINIRFYVFNDKEQDISIRLSISSWGQTRIRVKGSESVWVNGVATKIEDIFEENKTRNWLCSSYIYRIPIVILLAIPVGIAITLFFGTHTLDEKFLRQTMIYSGLPANCLYWIVGWLYPKIEYDEILLQTKIRKKVLAGLGIVIAGLFVSGLSRLF